MSPLQDTLETSMCAHNTLPACYGPVKDSPIPLWTGRVNSLERRNDTSGRGTGWRFAGPSSVGNRRATAFRDRFFACGETAITLLPALGAHMGVSSVSCIQVPDTSSGTAINFVRSGFLASQGLAVNDSGFAIALVDGVEHPVYFLLTTAVEAVTGVVTG